MITKIEEQSPAFGFFSGLSAWNIIMLVIMICGFYATTVSFRTHVSDFEKQAKIEIMELKEKDKEFEDRIRPIELKSTKIEAELKYIHKGIDRLNEKFDTYIGK